MTKHETGNEFLPSLEQLSIGRQDSLVIRHWPFVIVSSFVIGHSSFSA